MRATRTQVAVCIATAGRPLGLRRLLASLPQGTQSAAADVTVIVVDNAEGAPVQDVDALEGLAERPVTVLRERRPGIPFARNRALAHAVAYADVVVFVDDDEEVQPDWLRAHLDGLAAFGADVTVGPVLPVLPDRAPPWAADGAFHRSWRPAAPGAIMRTAPTSNTAVAVSVVAGVTPWFDPALAASGGSDFEYFTRVAAAGHRIVWIHEAVVHEHIPPERARLGWVVRRAFRVGAVEGLVLRSGKSAASRQVVLQALKGLALVAIGFLKGVAGAVTGRRAAIVGLTRTARGMGILTGLVGLRPRRYH